MTRSKWVFTFSLFAGMAVANLPAYASRVWSWSYSGDSISASGTFTTLDGPNAQGGYLITAISGTRNGKVITALQPTGTWIPGNEPYAVDNLIFPGPGPQLTKNGFGFAIADGTYSNPFYANFLPTPEYLEFFSMPNSQSSTELPVTFSATPTPEPTTFALFLAVLAFCCYTVRYKPRHGGLAPIENKARQGSPHKARTSNEERRTSNCSRFLMERWF